MISFDTSKITALIKPRKTYLTSKKVSFLISFLFFIFGLAFLIFSGVNRYRDLHFVTLESLTLKTAGITSETIQNQLSTNEFVFTTLDSEIIASPITTKMTRLPFLSNVTTNEDRYWIGKSTTLSAGSLLVYQEVTKQIESQIHSFSVHLLFLLIVTMLAYGIVRMLIWYGFSGLEEIAEFCDKVTVNVASGDVSKLDISQSLTGLESEEVHAVGVAIQAMMKQIGSYLHQQSVFTHGMSHEFRTHLMTIQSDLDIIKDTVQAPEVFEELQDSLRGFKQLIDQLLLLARSQQQVKEQALEKVGLNGIIMENLEIYNTDIGEKQLTIDHKKLDKSVEYNVYPVLLDTLIRNLVSNAIKYSVPGTAIIISGDENGFSIGNYTKNLSQESIDKLFDLFRMGDSSRHDQKSHGIGGALIKKICEIHGWQLSTSIDGESLLIIDIEL